MGANIILGGGWLRKPSIATTVEGFSLIRLRAFKLANGSVETSGIYHGILTRPGMS